MALDGSKQVQMRRGSNFDHASFVGAAGEVTIDTDKNVIIVHDGLTPGGYPAAREAPIGYTLVHSPNIFSIVALTQAAYDALLPKDDFTLYIIVPLALKAETGGFSVISWPTTFVKFP